MELLLVGLDLLWGQGTKILIPQPADEERAEHTTIAALHLSLIHIYPRGNAETVCTAPDIRCNRPVL